jgi:type II secretory pathway component PulF
MSEFQFTACDIEGASSKGRMEADSAEAVGMELDSRGLIPISIKQRRTLGQSFKTKQTNTKWRIEEKILFTRKFCSLLQAGIPLLRVFDLVADQTRDPRVAVCLRHIADMIAGGMTISDAMATYPRLFDAIYLGALRTGEATGQLDSVLQHMADFLEREMVTRRLVKATVRYPAMVILAMLIAGTVVVGFVVPKFMSFYTHFGGELPGPTRLLLAISELIQGYWWIAPPLSLGTWIWWRQWTRTASGRRRKDSWLLALPIFGALFLKVAVSRFARLFGILFSAGIPAAGALQIVADGVGNAIVAGEVTTMRERLSMGESVAAMPQDAIMPKLVYQMLAIGFESGDVERMLGEVARHFDQEVEYDVRRLRDHIEPVLLVFLAAGVLLLALAVMLPMWNLPALLRG